MGDQSTNRSESVTDSIDMVPESSGSAMNVYRKCLSQVLLLLNKRTFELRQNPTELVKLYIGPLLFFVLVILFYEQFGDLFQYGILPYGTFETYLIPPAFWIIIVKTVTYAMNEKATKIKESMRMMGLLDLSYYIAMFLSEGVVGGFILSMISSWFTFYPHFFNNAPYGDILGLFFVNCLASVPFALFCCSFFDTAQTASQIVLLFLIGAYALFAGVLATDSLFANAALACLLPPLGFQVGCNYLSNPGTDSGHPDIQMVIGILFFDIFLYTALTWYFSQVWPSAMGVSKHPLFLFSSSYWFPRRYGEESEGSSNPNASDDTEQLDIPVESVDEKFVGRPTVRLEKLRKSFGGVQVVRDLSFSLYKDQIFCLLGHNGAGKTTTINILTGAMPCDFSGHKSGAWIYGHSIHESMDEIRKTMGVCPQHDVLFENLSVLETIAFFSQLKGTRPDEARKEAEKLCRTFHLEKRKHHMGSELSGGQKRKLSVAIAICGGSKFVILDEPTAGMDPLARRELWDLLSSLRRGRTMLLTTHYMDECNVLADRTAIINLGGLACLGSNGFLKKKLGAGYRLVFDIEPSQTTAQAEALVEYVQGAIKGASVLTGHSRDLDEAAKGKQKKSKSTDMDKSMVFSLPFEETKNFGTMLVGLDSQEILLEKYGVSNCGMNIADLEEVFMSVGSDSTVTPSVTDGTQGIGSKVPFHATASAQVWAIYYRRLAYALHDVVTIPMLLLPLAAVIGGAVVSTSGLQITPVSAGPAVNDVMISFCVGCIYFGGYLAVPGLIGEFLISERNNRCRNLLTVMGCDFRSYWLGSFLADFTLLSVPLVSLYISWGVANMNAFTTSNNGAAFFVLLLFTAQLIGFSYLWSFVFLNAKACAALMPLIIIGLFLLPMVLIMLGILVWVSLLNQTTIDIGATIGSLFWGMALFSPHGGLLVSLMDTTSDFQNLITGYPPFEAVMAIMVVECVLMLGASYMIDSGVVSELEPREDPTASLPSDLDEDVRAERTRALDTRLDRNLFISAEATEAARTLLRPQGGALPPPRPPGQMTNSLQSPLPTAVSMAPTNASAGDADVEMAIDTERLSTGFNSGLSKLTYPLRVKKLRKVFAGKKGGNDVVATQDCAFVVEEGECFGLLGANGAGKSTTIAMITRHLVPTAGDAFVNGTSVLKDFTTAAQSLGVVTQNNSLWSLLSVEQHLRLFARLRGVPGGLLEEVVSSTLDQMELRPHRAKLACRLSGGMKRKLCVAISLIGDPAVVLLDEPSAGLDPKSRRNLWDVILRTMSHRCVVLTTHSLEEAEALCGRIGIMVKGQLRVLGTKQHLKNKFGSGYEIVIKLSQERMIAAAEAKAVAAAGSGEPDSTKDTENGVVSNQIHTATIESHEHIKFLERERKRARMGYMSTAQENLVAVEAFLREKFPSAKLVNSNGGVLATFSISRQEMKIGFAFTALESNKDRLNIEEYTISQPTLEQVFIRTVKRHTPKLRKKQVTQTARLIADGTGNVGFVVPTQAHVQESKMQVASADILASTSYDSTSGELERNSSVRLSVDGTLDMVEGEEVEEEDETANAESLLKNDCGFLPWQLRYIAYVFTFLAILFMFLGITGNRKFREEDRQVPTFYAIAFPAGIIFLIVACTGCCCMCCPCCNTKRKNGGLDEF